MSLLCGFLHLAKWPHMKDTGLISSSMHRLLAYCAKNALCLTQWVALARPRLAVVSQHGLWKWCWAAMSRQKTCAGLVFKDVLVCVATGAIVIEEPPIDASRLILRTHIFTPELR
jgi:hypothetical protein